VFTEPLHSNGRGADPIENSLSIVEVSLPSRCLATLWPSTFQYVHHVSGEHTVSIFWTEEYQTEWSHIPDDSTLQYHYRGTSIQILPEVNNSDPYPTNTKPIHDEAQIEIYHTPKNRTIARGSEHQLSYDTEIR
jgi:hypothetical protein